MLREGAEAVQAKPGVWIMSKSPRRSGPLAPSLFSRGKMLSNRWRRSWRISRWGLDEACDVFQGSCSWEESRLARKLGIEDVAEQTKIRPDRIIDLEADEYSHFPNLTYAKSFLAKYASFLGRDIQEELDKPGLDTLA